MSEESLSANFLDPSPLAGPVNEFLGRLERRACRQQDSFNCQASWQGSREVINPAPSLTKTSSPARQACWGRLLHSAEWLRTTMISYEVLCTFYALSMHFLCDSYIVFEPILAVKRPFSRGISRSASGAKKIRVQRTNVPSSRNDRLAVQSQKKHSWDDPGSVLDRSWLDSGFILGSSWVHPGFILGSSWSAKAQKSRRILGFSETKKLLRKAPKMRQPQRQLSLVNAHRKTHFHALTPCPSPEGREEL